MVIPDTTPSSTPGALNDGAATLPILCRLKTVEGGFDRLGQIGKIDIQLSMFNENYIITILSYRARGGVIDHFRMVHQFRLWEDEQPCEYSYIWDYAKTSSVTLDVGNRDIMRTAIVAEPCDGEEGQMWGCSFSGNNLPVRFSKTGPDGSRSMTKCPDWTGKLLAVNGGEIKFVLDHAPERAFGEIALRPDEIEYLKGHLQTF